MRRYHVVPPTAGGQTIQEACAELECVCVLTHSQDSAWWMLEIFDSRDLAEIPELAAFALAPEAFPAYIAENADVPCDPTQDEAAAVVGTFGASGSAWTTPVVNPA